MEFFSIPESITIIQCEQKLFGIHYSSGEGELREGWKQVKRETLEEAVLVVGGE